MADKIGYIYFPDGLFRSQTIIQESPLEPGVFIYPPNVTEIAPPEPREGFAIFFENGEWRLREVEEPIVPVPDPHDSMAATMIAIRLTLLANDQLDIVEDYFRNEASRLNILIWRYAGFIERNDRFARVLGGVLDLDDAGLDTLFIDAARVTL